MPPRRRAYGARGARGRAGHGLKRRRLPLVARREGVRQPGVVPRLKQGGLRARHRVATGGLGKIHRLVRTGENEFCRVVRAIPTPDPDADRDGEGGGPGGVEDGAPHPFSDDLCAARIGARQERHELVAAEPPHKVVWPQALSQQFAGRSQHGVALAVPVEVVDILEVVDVNRQQRIWRAVAKGALVLFLEAKLAGAPIRAVRDRGRQVTLPCTWTRLPRVPDCIP